VLAVPYAGGGATVFHRWPDGLPDHVEVRAVQLPARQDRLREPGILRIDAIVESISAALDGLPPAPLVVYGHSFGAIVAFELARRRPEVVHLVAAAGRPPSVARTRPPLHPLSDEAFRDALHERFGTPRAILDNTSLMRVAMPSMRADFEALETYIPGPSPVIDAPITALAGSLDAGFPVADQRHWQVHTRGVYAEHVVEAGHFFCDTHRAWVLERVRATCAVHAPENA
jgi:surfactin synthase thioesterase subunit